MSYKGEECMLEMQRVTKKIWFKNLTCNGKQTLMGNACIPPNDSEML